MKKTIIEEYNDAGKLSKKTTIEEDTDKFNGMYNPYSPYNPLVKPTITNIPSGSTTSSLGKVAINESNDGARATTHKDFILSD